MRGGLLAYLSDLRFEQGLTRPMASVLYVLVIAFSVITWIGSTVRSFQTSKIYGTGSGFYALFAGAVAVVLAAAAAKMILGFFLQADQKSAADTATGTGASDDGAPAAGER